MEKFVTDLDKLLDEFENEDMSSNMVYAFSDSSGYNSLKTSTELYPSEFPTERNVSQFADINESVELSTPTCDETSVIDTICNDFTNETGLIDPIATSTSENNIATNNDLSLIFPTISENQCSHETKLIDNTNEPEIKSNHSPLPESPNNYHVPPKKKSRPNSLFGLTNITTFDDQNRDKNSFSQIPSNSNLNTILPNNESPGNSLTSKKPIKRPLSLNIMSTNEKCDVIPNSEIIDGDLTISQSHFEQLMESDIENSQSLQSKTEKKENVVSDLSEWQGIPIEELGLREPMWVKDDLTNKCMQCEQPFTIFRRRHHCRACGRLLCSKCCCWRMQLQFSSRFFPKDRVCAVCFQYLIRIEVSRKHSQKSVVSTLQPHNSVLKSSPRPQSLVVSPFNDSDDLSISDSLNNSNPLKSVTFFDGIRPGTDLLETGKSRIITPTKYQNSQNKVEKLEPIFVSTCREPNLINNDLLLPPLVLDYKTNLIINSNTENVAQEIKIIENSPIIVAISRNLHVHLEIIQLTYCTCTINHAHNNSQSQCTYECIDCWYFASMGLETIGLEEVIIVLKKLPNENYPPMEIFHYYFQIYKRAFTNETKFDNLEMTIELFPEKNINFKDWAGILHIRSTFQCLDKLPLPHSSFLIGILIHKWELPWANVLPLRLLLALGNQSRFYPCSIISDRFRSSVYVEISQTILQIINPVFSFPSNLEQGIVDKNSLKAVPGMWIHLLASQETIIQITKLSYHTILDILSHRQSEFNNLALVASFSREADSHLVCCQNEDSCKYFSGAISIQHTERTVTGATMIIFVACDNSTEHGATIVEDVLVVRLSLMQLSSVINSLKTMSNLVLQWDSLKNEIAQNKMSLNHNESFVSRTFIKIVWTENHQFAEMSAIERPSLVTDETIQTAFLNVSSDENAIVKSYRVPYSLQILSTNQDVPQSDALKFVWTRFHYFVSGNARHDSLNDDPLDVEDMIRNIAIYFSKSLSSFLELLRESGLVNLGLRINIDNENVQYQAQCSKKYAYSALTPDQSPTEESGSNQSSYICSKMGNSRKFHSLNLNSLPDVCIESVNEVLVPFLYSQTAQIRTGSIISEYEFHIID